MCLNFQFYLILFLVVNNVHIFISFKAKAQPDVSARGVLQKTNIILLTIRNCIQGDESVARASLLEALLASLGVWI